MSAYAMMSSGPMTYRACVGTMAATSGFNRSGRSSTVVTPRPGEGSRVPDDGTKLPAALAIAGEGALPLIGASLNKLVFIGDLAEPSTPYAGGVRLRRTLDIQQLLRGGPVWTRLAHRAGISPEDVASGNALTTPVSLALRAPHWCRASPKVIARTLLAFVPELGILSRWEIASLVGVAPLSPWGSQGSARYRL
jgi:hypothetical protein